MRRPQSSAAGRPFVFLNLAMTADGKIATANRALASFGSRRDREHLFELRVTADAVMCGAGTLRNENVDLAPGPARFRRMRLRNGLAEANLRVIVSGSGALDPDARIFQEHVSPLIILTTARAGQAWLRRLRELGAEVRVCGRREIDFPEALAWLRREHGVKRLLCEGGGELNDALFRAGLVDEVNVTLCPKVVGGREAPTLADGIGFSRLADAAQFRLKSVRRAGDELFLVWDRG